MSRPLRLQFPGAVYHLTSRGNARQRIVIDDTDRQTFLDILAHVIARYGWRCHAYCLMDNHYHLLIETPKPTLAIGMRQLNGVYTQTFNRRHRRVGHLFQGRYKAILVEKQAHLLELCRYVVLNPLRVKARTRVEHWEWSSYRATAGLAPVPKFLTVDWVLRQFGQHRPQAQVQYRNFVRAGLKSQVWQQLRGQIYLGSDEFIKRLSPATENMREVPRPQWQAVKPPLRELLGKRGGQAIAVAYREYGYRLREIADHLNVHYATVSRKLRALETEKKRAV